MAVSDDLPVKKIADDDKHECRADGKDDKSAHLHFGRRSAEDRGGLWRFIFGRFQHNLRSFRASMDVLFDFGWSDAIKRGYRFPIKSSLLMSGLWMRLMIHNVFILSFSDFMIIPQRKIPRFA
jgi:hypothetical protein